MNRKLTSRQIHRAARFLQARGQLSGSGLRALLYKRHGARGSVERIYEIVRELTGRRPRAYGSKVSAAPVPRVDERSAVQDARGVVTEEGDAVDVRVEALVHERDAARARVALVEERYESDTARWMREVDQLRTRLGQEGRPTTLIYGRDPRDVVRDLEAQLAQAQRRILALEARHVDRAE